MLCPNAGCKRSEDNNPFRRLDHLKRHLKTCKHKKDTDLAKWRSVPLSTTTLTTEPSGGLQRCKQPEVQARQHRSTLSTEDDDLDYENLLQEMEKKYLKLSAEVEKREREYLAAKDARDSLQQAIQALKKTNDCGSERSCMRD